jgi:TrmH family RNA methyltransferase
MLSKNKIKFIQSLKLKKYRQKYNNFLAEGDKIIRSFLDMNHSPEVLYSVEEWWNKNKAIYSEYNGKIEIVSDDQLKQISLLSTPPPVAGIFKLKEFNKIDEPKAGSYFYLDGIQDPGNLGTIIRTLDWFGVNKLYLSKDCVDPFNPKTVQASMGSVLNLDYIEAGIEALSTVFKIYGASMDGSSYEQVNYAELSLIVLGNEGQGIRDNIERYIETYITIPRAKESTVDSLNVSISLAIICGHLKLRTKTSLK